MKFKVGEFLTTRNGCKAMLYKITEGSLAGVLEYPPGVWKQNVWEATGMQYSPIYGKSEFDLIGEWVEPVEKHPAEDWIRDQKIMVCQPDGVWFKRFFAYFDKTNKIVYAFDGGQTSWTTNSQTAWMEARLPTDEELERN